MHEIIASLSAGAALLRQPPEVVVVWKAIVWLSALYLLTLGAGVFAAPKEAQRFLSGFAATPLTNLTEAVLRFIAGLALIGAAPDMRFGTMFLMFGFVLAATAIAIAVLPGAHRRYAKWAVPFALRIMPLFGAASIALGAFVIYAVVAR